MRFHRPARVRSQVMIIPLIDILLFLLIFFIASTQFKKPRHTIIIETPTVREIPTQTIGDSRSVITVDALGKISIDDIAVPEGLLESYLAAFVRENPGRKLQLDPDGKITLQQLIDIQDSITKAGLKPSDVPARVRQGKQ